MPHVMIIDDEPGIRFALRRYFERRHWSVTEAGDGESALAGLLSVGDVPSIDLVVCDLNLPGITGEQIVARLAAERPALVDRVILSTGDDIAGAPPGSFLARHPFLLQKPFDLASLGRLVGAMGLAIDGTT